MPRIPSKSTPPADLSAPDVRKPGHSWVFAAPRPVFAAEWSSFERDVILLKPFARSSPVSSVRPTEFSSAWLAPDG